MITVTHLLKERKNACFSSRIKKMLIHSVKTKYLTTRRCSGCLTRMRMEFCPALIGLAIQRFGLRVAGMPYEFWISLLFIISGDKLLDVVVTEVSEDTLNNTIEFNEFLKRKIGRA